jgi:hypothetical protein
MTDLAIFFLVFLRFLFHSADNKGQFFEVYRREFNVSSANNL